MNIRLQINLVIMLQVGPDVHFRNLFVISSSFSDLLRVEYTLCREEFSFAFFRAHNCLRSVSALGSRFPRKFFESKLTPDPNSRLYSPALIDEIMAFFVSSPKRFICLFPLLVVK